MQRSFLALLLVLALVAGFTARSVFFQSARSSYVASEVAGQETAGAFYDALNDVLGGARTEPLAGLLSSIFVDHSSDTGTAQSADAFLNEVSAMGASPAQLRLEVLSIESAGGNLVVGIQQTRAGAVEVAGLTVEQPAPASHYEVLRVEQGKIVDRWAPEFRWLETFDSDDAAMSIASFSGFVTTLARVELIDSTEHAWLTEGIGAVIVESGSAILQITRGSEAPAPVVLQQGSITKIPNGLQARLRSADGKPLSVVIYVVTRSGPADGSLPAGGVASVATGGSHTVLWSGPLYWTQSATVHRPAWIVLPAGEGIELTRLPGSDLLIGVDAGVIEVGVAGGGIEILGEDRWPVSFEGVVEMDENQAGSISGDGAVFVRNTSDTPVTLVLISIKKEFASELPITP